VAEHLAASQNGLGSMDLVGDAVQSVGIAMVQGLREWENVFNDVLLP
jgi:hypothetical protein